MARLVRLRFRKCGKHPPRLRSLCRLSDQFAEVACRWYNLTHRKAVHFSTVYYCPYVMVRIPEIWLCV